MSRVRLLALDLDGTLLDPEGRLRPAVREAVASARGAGCRVVVCTGRRERTARPLLDALGLDDGLAVLQNGVIVRDLARRRTHRRRALEADVVRCALPLLREIGPPLAYVDPPGDGPDFYVEADREIHPFQADYLRDNAAFHGTVPSLEGLRSAPVVMLSCMAEVESLLELRPRLERALAGRARTNLLINKNYRGHILETVCPRSGKWPALLEVARELGIGAEEIAAIGDDENDVEMIAGAGIGVAMGNAIAAARQAADWITDSNAEDGVATAIARLLDA